MSDTAEGPPRRQPPARRGSTPPGNRTVIDPDDGPAAAAPPAAGPTLRDLGEFGLIDQVARRAVQGPAVALGPGDDAAIVLVRGGRVVASTDLLVEGRHFRRDWSTGYQVGRKAAAQNLADIAAMGAEPTALLVGLSAPGDLPVAWAAELARGLAEESAQVGASVAGGDTTSGATLLIAVTALGDLPSGPAVTRAGARPGDVVAVAGELGWSACGLDLLLRGAAGLADGAGHPVPDTASAARASESEDDASARAAAKALARYHVPEPPYAAGPAAARAGATAMLDVSDGLLADLGHIAAESGVAIDVDPAAFPPQPGLAVLAEKLGADPLAWILTGGEDHALAACFPAADRIPEHWLPIGRVGERLPHQPPVTVAGLRWPGRLGWDHFSS
ncbi:MAG TPA: thiamine-phosphate kinase [Actinocrinis sp.]